MVRFWVGGYGSAGIALAELDQAEGSVTVLGRFGCAPDPSYLCLSPDEGTVLAVHEDERDPGVSSFKVGEGSRLSSGGHVATPAGAGCHVACSRGVVLVSCYGTGKLLSLGFDGGALGPVRQEFAYPGGRDASHAHQAVFSPDGGFVHACDLGADMVWAHRFEPGSGVLGEPVAVAMPPGSGPRHMVWTGEQAWVLGELDATLHPLPGVPASPSPLPPRVPLMEPGQPGMGWGAAVRVVGDDLVASLRDPSCLVFVGPTGVRRVPTPGSTPRDFACSHCGRWLVVAHQGSHTVQALRLEDASWGQPAEVESPTCVLMAG